MGGAKPKLRDGEPNPTRGDPTGNAAIERIPAASRLLTPEDVAEVTGLSVETLAQWRSQKRGISYVKISRNCVRYRQSDLDGWLAERIVRTDQDVPKTQGRT
jgi:predicted DNA-binding transcriptional regulator AlpA